MSLNPREEIPINKLATQPKSSNKEINDLLKAAYQQGWRGKKGKRSPHLKLYSPNGTKIVTIPISTKSRRAVENLKSELKSGGLEY